VTHPTYNIDDAFSVLAADAEELTQERCEAVLREHTDIPEDRIPVAASEIMATAHQTLRAYKEAFLVVQQVAEILGHDAPTCEVSRGSVWKDDGKTHTDLFVTLQTTGADGHTIGKTTHHLRRFEGEQDDV